MVPIAYDFEAPFDGRLDLNILIFYSYKALNGLIALLAAEDTKLEVNIELTHYKTTKIF